MGSYGSAFAQGDVIKISLNMDTGQLVFYKNGTSQGLAYTVSAGTWYLAALYTNDSNGLITITGGT